ncbi:MAG: Holliday junction resolvase RuvX [Dehalococcoidales bacterium]|jgi:putative Holliday junction resolvase|nr:Holliday junction resolvase RuvX [Dehalococcoidales bacterium]MDD4322290.1 Holliday junction resolvase RuvX [Dehalococcoidales bacterium]MDD4794132.1 Holliday junction resolvase RuvX [Dehalococcoidales bacterium]MDX9803364.1 Holliday junction resolvase RuvX [Dehalococcoidales bacterium]
MAVDIGEKWLGIALSDPLRLIASPLKTVRCESQEEILDALGVIARQFEVKLIVAGLPRSLDGSTGGQEARTQIVIDAIREKLGIAVECQDERYSTSRAKDIMTGKKRRAGLKNERDDAIAAAVILDDYLKTHLPPSSDITPVENGN